MKNLLILVAIVCATLTTFAQAPQNINYQAVVRNNAGDVVKNQSVRFRLSITEGAAGVTTYSETHQTTTNSLGLVTLTIGSGTVATGTFASVNWATGQKFLKIEVDAAGGTSYTLMGSQQLVSVPYALHANTAGGVLNQWQNSSAGLYYNSGRVGIGTDAPNHWLSIVKNGDGSNFNDDRNFLLLNNTSTKNDATATIRINAGQNSTSTTLNHHSSAYNIVSGFANFGQLSNNGAGLILQSSNTDGVIKFQTGGITERMRIDKIGNIGIGTNLPLTKLHLEGNEDGSGSSDTRNFIYIKNTTTSTSGAAGIGIQAGSQSGETRLWHISPQYASRPQDQDFGTLYSSGQGLSIWSSNRNSPTTGKIKFQVGGDATGGFDRMVINEKGNVGIGTSNPTSRLNLEVDASGFTTGNEPDGRFLLDLKNTSTSTASQAVMKISAGNGGNYMNISHSSSSYSINSNTDCGSIWSCGTGGLILQASPKSGTDPDLGGIRFLTGWANVSGGSTERMKIDKNGNLGIGTSTPKAKVEVANGDVYLTDSTKGIILKSPNGNCWRVTVDNTGNLIRTAISCPN